MKMPAISPDPPPTVLAAVDVEVAGKRDLASPELGLAVPHTAPDPKALARSLVESYPPKVERKRAKHIVINEPDATPIIEANVRTVPGIITQRGCCYAGCKGVVLGPVTDIVHIVHGPVGCSYYAWMTRRNQADVPEGEANYLPYSFTTDMTEHEIIFGGEEKLAQAIREAYETFHPKAIAVFSTLRGHSRPVRSGGEHPHPTPSGRIRRRLRLYVRSRR